jgi:Fur family peroxide stress response transcriptional regulator
MIHLERLNESIVGGQRKLTRQRRLVLEALQQSREHLDASELYQLVRIRDPKISLATVYRTLALLKEMGLVSEQRLGEEHGHFEMVPQTPHYHFTCRHCGRVIEFELPNLAEALQRMADQQGLCIQSVQLAISGLCDSCLAEKADARTSQEPPGTYPCERKLPAANNPAGA